MNRNLENYDNFMTQWLFLLVMAWYVVLHTPEQKTRNINIDKKEPLTIMLK